MVRNVVVCHSFLFACDAGFATTQAIDCPRPPIRRVFRNRARRGKWLLRLFRGSLQSLPLGMAWKCGPPGFLLSTRAPNAFREIAKAPRLWADAEIELEASAGQSHFWVDFYAGRVFFGKSPAPFFVRAGREICQRQQAPKSWRGCRYLRRV